MAPFKPRDGSIKFKEATQKMSLKEKIDYTWEYYKGWLIASMAAVLIIFYIINTTRLTTHLHLTVTSGFAHTSGQFQLEDLEDADEEVFAFNVMPQPYGFMVDVATLSTTLEERLLEDEQDATHAVIVQHLPLDFETMPVFTTLTGAGELDIIITYQHDFEAMIPMGQFRNMRDLAVDLPDHLLIHDQGILLRYLPIFDDYIHPHNPDVELILGVVASSNRIREVEHFLQDMLE